MDFGRCRDLPVLLGWPCTVDVNTGNPQSTNSLADVAQYYYITDLRTPANEPRGPAFYDDNVPAVGSGAEDDKARWQHMTTFSIALGVSGTIKYVSDYKTSTVSGATDTPIDTRFADIRVGQDTRRQRRQLAALARSVARLQQRRTTTTTRARSTTSGTRR